MKYKKIVISFLFLTVINISNTCLYSETIKSMSTPGKIDAKLSEKYEKIKTITILSIIVITGIILAYKIRRYYKSLPNKIKESIKKGMYKKSYGYFNIYMFMGGSTKNFSVDEIYSMFCKGGYVNELLNKHLNSALDCYNIYKKAIEEKDYENAYLLYKKSKVSKYPYETVNKETVNKYTPDEIAEIYIKSGKLNEFKNDEPIPVILILIEKIINNGDINDAMRINDILFDLKESEKYGDKIIEIYDRAGRIDDLYNYIKFKRPPYMVNSLISYYVKNKKYDKIITLFEVKTKSYPEEMTEADWQLMIAAYSQLNKLKELKINTIPREMLILVAQSMVDKGMHEEAMVFLYSLTMKDWKEKEYQLWIEICLISENYEKIFVPLDNFDFKNDSKKEKIFKLYYETGLKLEEDRKMDVACKIYERFVNENVPYKDIFSRYMKLSGGRPSSVGLKRPLSETVVGGTHTGESEYIGKKYQIIREIGRGGMGIVYEAVNKEIGKKVAIKKMKEELAINPREKKRFLEEARRVAELHHPNIVDIYDMFEESGNVYLVFEYVDGETVDNILNHKTRFSLENTKRIIFAVCSALEYAHNKRIIHRDIKPSNIMETKERYVKIMDFGIAREAKDTLSRLTGKDTSGTMAYMAPEQHLGSYDARSDVFSLGVTMSEMITGELPFKGPDFYLQKEKMIYRPASELVPELPKQIDELISKCLQADKEKRYKTVNDLIMDLRDIAV